MALPNGSYGKMPPVHFMGGKTVITEVEPPAWSNTSFKPTRAKKKPNQTSAIVGGNALQTIASDITNLNIACEAVGELDTLEWRLFAKQASGAAAGKTVRSPRRDWSSRSR